MRLLALASLHVGLTTSAETSEFPKDDVRKVVAMAGILSRRIADPSICSSDLCTEAAEKILNELGWPRDSIDALIMVTQSPDYLLPSTSCIIHKHLQLSDECAAFDVGLGCSGYPYAIWLAAMMLNSGGLKRVLVLHGDTSSRFSDKSDRSVALLFGDLALQQPLKQLTPKFQKTGFSNFILMDQAIKIC